MRRVLDPASGTRMMWDDKANPDVIFGDIRTETITVTDRSHGNTKGTRTLNIEPDMEMDFRNLPFDDGVFNLVAFDPPHLVRAGPKSWLAAKYGKLSDDWRDDLRQGFKECFRVLHPDGTLVFKWNETQIKVREVLDLAPMRPLFGHLSGRKSLTHWLVFMKPQPQEIECTNCNGAGGFEGDFPENPNEAAPGICSECLGHGTVTSAQNT